MARINVADAKANLSKLIDRALAGEEVVISRRNQPVVKLIAVAPSARRGLEPGWLAGQVWMADDFDAPLEDFEDYR